MKTFTITFVLSLCLLMTSCNINFSYPEKITGEGEVISEQIVLDNFSDLKVEKGWEVKLIPSDSNYMIVEANENLFEVFEYEQKSGKLTLSSTKQISKADSKTILLHYTKTLESIQASSGSELTSEAFLTFKNLVLDISSGAEVYLDAELTFLELETSSGSDVNLILELDDLVIDSSSGSSATLMVNAISIDASSSSGSDIELEGTTQVLKVESSSGSSIHSKALESEHVIAKASSGSSIDVYPIKDLEASISSGGSIYYHNKPSGLLNFDKSKSGGSIELK